MMFNSVEGASTSTVTVVDLDMSSARDDTSNGRNISGEVFRRVGECT